jgi:hypothetical protein
MLTVPVGGRAVNYKAHTKKAGKLILEWVWKCKKHRHCKIKFPESNSELLKVICKSVTLYIRREALGISHFEAK